MPGHKSAAPAAPGDANRMNIQRHHMARNNMQTRRQKRAWEAVFALLLALSVCFALMAACGAIGLGGTG
jgi:hypothetical protein